MKSKVVGGASSSSVVLVLFMFTITLFILVAVLTRSTSSSSSVVALRPRSVHSVFPGTNWATNVDTKYNRAGSFDKVGVIRDHESGKLKPLLSRQISPTRHQYFTSENHDGFMMNMPLFDMSGRSCTSGAGCNDVWDGDGLKGIDGSHYSVLRMG